jgi:hypothetical protein
VCTKLTLKACKLVAGMLPFSEKIEMLSRDRELIKNLLLGSSICKTSVEMILESLLE